MGPSRQRLQTAALGQHPTVCVPSIIETGAGAAPIGFQLQGFIGGDNDCLRALLPTLLK